jgi:hypothetical protein
MIVWLGPSAKRLGVLFLNSSRRERLFNYEFIATTYHASPDFHPDRGSRDNLQMVLQTPAWGEQAVFGSESPAPARFLGERAREEGRNQ